MQMSDNALLVLRPLAETAMDGYMVMKRTNLAPEALSRAVRELVSDSLIDVKGDLGPDGIGEAYLFVPSNAQDHVRFLIQQLRSSSD